MGAFEVGFELLGLVDAIGVVICVTIGLVLSLSSGCHYRIMLARQWKFRRCQTCDFICSKQVCDLIWHSRASRRINQYFRTIANDKKLHKRSGIDPKS